MIKYVLPQRVSVPPRFWGKRTIRKLWYFNVIISNIYTFGDILRFGQGAPNVPEGRNGTEQRNGRSVPFHGILRTPRSVPFELLYSSSGKRGNEKMKTPATIKYHQHITKPKKSRKYFYILLYRTRTTRSVPNGTERN